MLRELQLLEKIYGRNDQLPSSVEVGPGDDLAVIRLGAERLLVGTDQLVDGVHIDLAAVGPAVAARKAVCRCFSDVAAMAAQPVGSLVSVVLPHGMEQAEAEIMFEAARVAASTCGGPLVGGDTAIGDGPLTMSVTVMAEPGGVEPVLRSGAGVGDVIVVSGELGGAWQAGADAHHLTFTPRIELARSLAHLVRLTSMIDLSDGLAQDLPRVCRASGVSAQITAELLPRRSGASVDAALCDGEDYELCFTVSASEAQKIPSEMAGVRLTRIGSMGKPVEAATCQLIEPDGTSRWPEGGWEHRG
jgi:thiamine-monophosphate kinase